MPNTIESAYFTVKEDKLGEGLQGKAWQRGKKLHKDDQKTYRYRLLDDDKEVYLVGRITVHKDGNESIFAPLDLFQPMLGVTEMQIRDGRGPWETV